MIKKLFEKMQILCGNSEEHSGEAPALEAADINGRGYIFYCCPRCLNRISMPDLERMVDKVDSMMTEGATQGELPTDMVNLTNVKWKNRRGVEYKILEHDWFSGQICVSIYNPMEISEQKAKLEFSKKSRDKQNK